MYDPTDDDTVIALATARVPDEWCEKVCTAIRELNRRASGTLFILAARPYDLSCYEREALECIMESRGM